MPLRSPLPRAVGLLGAAVLCALAVPAAFAQDDERRPPLFLLEDDDSRVYLLGSIHMLPPGGLPMPPSIEAAYQEADVLAFELDLDGLQAGAQAMMQAAVGETSLAEALSPEQKAAFDSLAAGLGLPPGALDRFEPWMASLTMTTLLAQRTGLTGMGVDAYFTGRAKEDGKERIALETFEQQTAFFDDLPTEDQVAMLMTGIEGGTEAMREMLGDMYTAWSEGDDATLVAVLTEAFDETPTLYQTLLLDRNRAWVPQVEALLGRASGTALVVVGAAHLVGEGSVVELLEARGHTLRRL